MTNIFVAQRLGSPNGVRGWRPSPYGLRHIYSVSFRNSGGNRTQW